MTLPSSAAAAVSPQLAEGALRRCVERLVAARFGPRPAITAIERRRSDHSSSYAADVVIARLATGEGLKVFLKDFSTSVSPKDELERRRHREVRVYRELLPGAGLGTAGYYDCDWDEAQGRFWLFLEFVEGTPLRYCELDSWVEAAGWLARLHAHFAGQADRLRGCDFLARHDADFFWAKARLALDAVSAVSPPLAGRLAGVLGRYDRCVEVMAGQPPALVHGAYKPRHILVDAHSQPLRLCPVDWELAAVGSAFYDLAFLAYGFQPPKLDRFLDAYRCEARVHGLPMPDRERLRHVIDCFRLHRVLKTLAGSLARGLPEETVAKLVESAERLSNDLC